jgi:hypothetical protein
MTTPWKFHEVVSSGTTPLYLHPFNWLIDEKFIDFVTIKFHSNENIECHCMQIELDSKFQIYLNWIQIY